MTSVFIIRRLECKSVPVYHFLCKMLSLFNGNILMNGIMDVLLLTNSHISVLSFYFRNVYKVSMWDPINLGFPTKIDTN